MKKTITVIALAASLIGMTGCTTDTTQAAPASPAPVVTTQAETATDPNAIPEPVIANPVTIIKKIDGLTLDNPDAKVGEFDFDGNRYVSGSYMNNCNGECSGTSVTVWTFDPSWPLPEALPMPDDTTDIITGEGFAVVIGGATLYSTKIDVQAMAEKLGGTLMPL